MSISFLKRKPFILLYVAGAILLGVAAWLSWNNLNTKPERVFWNTISQSLSTSAVTVQATQGQGENVSEQTVQFSLGGRNVSRTLTSSNQPGTTVQATMLSTPTNGYVQYNVTTDQKRPNGKPMDFSKVNGVWAKSGSGQQQLSQDLLGTGLPLGGVAVPIADLSPEKRAKLVDQMQHEGVYKTSFSSVKKERQRGRLVYIYTVQVQPVAYANMMKSLAQGIGLHELDNLDTKVFEGKQPFELMLTVDVRARHLLKAEATSGADIKQIYTAYDVPVTIAPPAKTIDSGELQKRIAEAQQ